VLVYVEGMTPTAKQLAFLKTLAHDKKPIVLLGHKGVTDAVIKETGAALLAHELVKIRLHGEDKEAIHADASAVAKGAGAVLVDVVGKVAILYKRHPDEPKIVLPKDKPARG
jgi:RNA-binding protein